MITFNLHKTLSYLLSSHVTVKIIEVPMSYEICAGHKHGTPVLPKPGRLSRLTSSYNDTASPSQDTSQW